MLLFAVVILYLDTDNQSHSAINSYSIDPSMSRILNRLDSHIDGTKDDQQLEGKVREGLLGQLKERLDFRDTLDVCAITIKMYLISYKMEFFFEY